MPVTIRVDEARPNGGFALLRTDNGVALSAVAFEDRSSGLYLGPDGKWVKTPHFFLTEGRGNDTAGLGPEIVDHIPWDTPLCIHAPRGVQIGNAIWTGIPPSAGISAGAVLVDPSVEQASIQQSLEVPQVPSSEPQQTSSSSGNDIKFDPIVPPAMPSEPINLDNHTAKHPGTWTRWLVPIVLGALIVVAGLIGLGRDSQFAKALVCNADGALHNSGWAASIVPCPKSGNGDEQAHNDFLQCLVGKSGCEQKSCAEGYLKAQPSGAYASEVRSAQEQIEKVCLADKGNDRLKQDFSAFNECMRATANVCDQNACVDRFKTRLTVEPYVSSLKQAAQTATQACARLQEEVAFAAFNQCVAQTVPCDTARCAATFTKSYPNSGHIAQVLQVAEQAARTCKQQAPIQKPEPTPPSRTPEAAARSFLSQYYYVSSSQGEAAGNDLSDLFAPTVNFYGKMRTRNDIMIEKRAYNARWDGRRFLVQPDSLSVSCDGDTCRVSGRVQWDFESSLLRRNSRGMSSIEFTFANVLTNPKVISEWSKVDERY